MDTGNGAGMRPLAYTRAATAAQALQACAQEGAQSDETAQGAMFIAGGTNLVDLMKLQIMRPHHLIDLNATPLADIVVSDSGGLRLGAMARNAQTAYHPQVQQRYPLLAAAILAAASAQIRNMASNGGNLLQRTRCTYFYDPATPCNKRRRGSGCSAIGGLNKYHAILGASEHCIATHPSDMCVALAALDASVHVRGPAGAREIAFAEFHRLPGAEPERDTVLEEGELIEYIALPDADDLVAHSAYLKIRERLSYAFGLVSVAAALALDDDGRIVRARIALGGVAHKPWRRPESEVCLVGLVPGREAFGHAADLLLEGAVAQHDNGFKITLARRTVVRALEAAAAGTQVAHPGRGVAA
ncbi:MAG: FAD binding domain-containing protein [Pseudoxanthomonas sp.]